MVKTVGIIGYGQFGAFVHTLGQRFFPDIEYKIYSRRAEIDSQTFFSLEEAAQCDVLILCGSLGGYEEQLKAVVARMRVDSVLVDIATVKKHTEDLFQRYAADRQYICTHPMFGPASYQKQNEDVTGFRIVLTQSTLPTETISALRNRFAALGFLIIEMTADEHDRQLAETLFLTHYISQTILKAGYRRTTMDTVSFQFLMDAVESVQNDTALFADVYRFNPYCKAVVERLSQAQGQVFEKTES